LKKHFPGHKNEPKKGCKKKEIIGYYVHFTSSEKEKSVADYKCIQSRRI